MKMFKTFLILLAVGLALLVGWYVWRQIARPIRYGRMLEWLRHAEAHPDWAVNARQRCGDAPFSMPTAGYIGFLWGDSFHPGHNHQGLDFFGGQTAGVTPVYAAYNGYLTRQADWKSSLIIRIPQDPLNPGRQIWLYMTHLADPDGNSFIESAFPPGTHDKSVFAGDLLGFQGDYSGNPTRPVGVHLHFSIVRDDGNGHYLNELDINNTLDPSPYLGFELNAKNLGKSEIPMCQP